NFALNKELLESNFPFSTLKGEAANTLIFPNLESGNIAYKLLQEVGDAEAVGPILLGMNKPVHVLQLDSSVREIVNMVTIAVVDAQAHSNSTKETKCTIILMVNWYPKPPPMSSLRLGVLGIISIFP